MILRRLYELAEREGLLADTAFEEQEIAFVVNLADDGRFLGIDCHSGEREVPPPSGKGKPKKVRVKGVPLSVPKAHGNTANKGFACFFCDTLERALPMSDEPKHAASRATFWEQVALAADETGDASLRAVAAFGEALASDAALRARVAEELGRHKRGPGDRCTFAVQRDGGRAIVQLDPVRAWFRAFHERTMRERADQGPRGLCQVTGEEGPIATTHATKVSGLPGGLAMGVALVSSDKAAFCSYGLDSAANASIGYTAAEGYTRAVQRLIEGAPGTRSRLTVGATTFLFWTRDAAAGFDAASILDNPEPDAVAALLESARSGRPAAAGDPNNFYCLVLSANAARAVVRDYLESPVAVAQQNLAAWFADLSIINAFNGEITGLFPLWRLTAATAREAKEVTPHLPAMLVGAALRRLPLPDSVLAACCGRLRAEGGAGFRAERLALIRVCLNRSHKEHPMSEQLDADLKDRAYLCGRLLAVFERLQFFALGDVNATVVDRYYGTASTAPVTVFPRLVRSAEQHLSKLHGEKAGLAVNIQKEIEEIMAALPPRFPSTLPLSDQGRFALGFYHQRAAFRRQSPERKAAAATA
ncbi:MAG: type I-C CRISPR-associated protein Cas8c/Csd1 [Phycisphaerales bacterium]|nr:type I-C CRISPR-associated protein Cas8c/Csd1 [Phycisphaerales bacterium]